MLDVNGVPSFSFFPILSVKRRHCLSGFFSHSLFCLLFSLMCMNVVMWRQRRNFIADNSHPCAMTNFSFASPFFPTLVPCFACSFIFFLFVAAVAVATHSCHLIPSLDVHAHQKTRQKCRQRNEGKHENRLVTVT